MSHLRYFAVKLKIKSGQKANIKSDQNRELEHIRCDRYSTSC